MNRLFVPALLAAALMSCGCNRSAPAECRGDGQWPRDHLRRARKAVSIAVRRRQANTPATIRSEIQKLEVLRTLIDSEIMLQRAEKMGLMAADADVEAKYNELKAPYTQEEFQKQLNSRKMTAEDLKAQLRRDLSVSKLFNKEITSQISITDKDITDFYNSNKASFNLAEPQIHMAQILVTPTADPNVRNLKNDKAQDDDAGARRRSRVCTPG